MMDKIQLNVSGNQEVQSITKWAQMIFGFWSEKNAHKKCVDDTRDRHQDENSASTEICEVVE